jgi:hypothetical protein
MIKFDCPHCQKKLSVKDELAGKKGPCPGCKQIVTVPAAGAAPAAPAPAKPASPAAAKKAPEPPPPPPKPVPSPEELEAAAAAALADEPQAEEAKEPQFVEFQCPMCDEKVKLSAELAGKKASCPECRRIIKVPELVKPEKKDWRQGGDRLPSGARRPDQPEPEGAWGTAAATAVSRESLEEAGAAPEARVPLTTGQKVRRGVYAGVAVLALGAGYWFLSGLWAAGREQRLVKAARDYAANQEEATREIGREGLAALHGLLGEYDLRGRRPAADAKGQFERAIVLMQEGPRERDAVVLGDVAVAALDLGGAQAEVDKKQRLKWTEAHTLVQRALAAIPGPEGKREAFREVLPRLRERGQLGRGLPLASQLFEAGADQAEALALVGLAAHAAGDADLAKQAADATLALYADPMAKLPPRAEVVALAKLLKLKAPEGRGDEVAIGEAEALARQGSWAAARAAVQQLKGEGQFRGLLALTGAAVDANSEEKSAAAEAAVGSAEKEMKDRPRAAWLLLRLVRLGKRADLSDDRLKAAAGLIVDPDLRGRAQLTALEARLAREQKVTEESVLDGLESKSLAPLLGRAALARHNTRLDHGWARAVEKWDKGGKAFGAIGAALGLQKE